MRLTAFIACFLCVFVASAYGATVIKCGLIQWTNPTASSDVRYIHSNGDGNVVTLTSTVTACDKTLEWCLDSDGYIYQSKNTTLVLDVQNSNTANGAYIIMWYKKTGPGVNPANQLWNVTTTTIQSVLNGKDGFYMRKSTATDNVVNSNNPGAPQTFQFVANPYATCPVSCTSYGDPHFTTFLGKKYDFQSANTVGFATTSAFSMYNNQFPCNTGVTCNEGFVVQPKNSTDTFQISLPLKAYFNRNPVSLPSSTATYGYFTVTKVSNNAYTVTFPGVTIAYGLYSWVKGNYANIGVTLTAPATVQNSLCTGPASGQNAHTFGSQFLVKNKTDTAYVYDVKYPFTYDPNYVPNYGPYTPTDQTLIDQTTAACGQLTSPTGLGPCNSIVPVDFYNTSCYNDAYAMADPSFAQSSVDAYAQACQQAANGNGQNITLPSSPTTSMVTGQQSTVPANTQTSFWIITKDINGKPRTTGGDIFNITSTGPSTLIFTVTDYNNGTYQVTYTIGKEGVYTISVKLSYNDVSGSPFAQTSVAVTSASTSSLVLGPVPINQPAWFTVQARTSSGTNRVLGGDTFVVTFSGGSFTNVTVVDNNDGTYTVWYTPGTVGYYTVDVTYMGTSILCSPYTVIVK